MTFSKLLDLSVVNASSDNHFTHFKVNEIKYKNLVQHLVLSNNWY